MVSVRGRWMIVGLLGVAFFLAGLWSCSVLLPSGKIERIAPQADRLRVLDLSGPGWKLWRDKKAPWRDDKLYLPPVKLAEVPTTQPTVGWDDLYHKVAATDVRVPGTVDEYLWGAEGNPRGTEGHYQGVSYWWRDFTVPEEWRGKKLILRFQACRQRAEIYVNEKLLGYDVVGNTPFEVDITNAVAWGSETKAAATQASGGAETRKSGTNRLCVRITEPNDNSVSNSYDWADHLSLQWGNNAAQRIPPSHGFSGITGRVSLAAVDAVYVHDIFVKNKPSPSATRPTDADVDVEVINDTGTAQTAKLTLRVAERQKGGSGGETGAVVFEQTWDDVKLPVGSSTVSRSINAPLAKLWDVDSPNLYECQCRVTPVAAAAPGVQGAAAPVAPVAPVATGPTDIARVTFGFRWFAPENVGKPDACLKLNGKRIVVRSAISWGFWPISGIVPTPELAERQIRVAKSLGLNALSNHRTIPDPQLAEKADELGLLLYCEPGGYKCDKGDACARALAAEKLYRMIKRDRNHPSVMMYNMINEFWVRERKVYPEYLTDIITAHKLDPTRIITLADGQTVNGKAEPGGSWMMPYDMTRRETGWANEHHAGSPGVYIDGLYHSPTDYYLNEGPQDSILYWGEEGAISAPPQLEAMQADYKAAGHMGWDGDDYAQIYKGYTDWLKARHGQEAFASVDDLCRSLGDVAYYYQGRVIETVRATDRTDGYVVNGWECEKLENHSGIVDIWRRPKGNVATLAYYNQPLYVAVKARHKVAEPGTQVVCDFFLINEKDLKGDLTLDLAVTNDRGTALFSQHMPVKVTGGDKYGEILAKDIAVPVGSAAGYTHVRARLLSGAAVLTEGHDEIYVVDYRSSDIPKGGAILDSTGNVTKFLTGLKYAPINYADAKDRVPFIVAGGGTADEPTKCPHVDSILERVKRDGTTLVIIGYADQWAQVLSARKIIKYNGMVTLGQAWSGGGMFVLNHPLFANLPHSQAMNWEYQQVERYWNRQRGGRYGLLLEGDDAAVGCFNQHDPRLCTAVGVYSYGNGKIILSTLDISANLVDSDGTSAVTKRIFVNYLMYVGGATAETQAAKAAGQ